MAISARLSHILQGMAALTLLTVIGCNAYYPNGYGNGYHPGMQQQQFQPGMQHLGTPQPIPEPQNGNTPHTFKKATRQPPQYETPVPPPVGGGNVDRRNIQDRGVLPVGAIEKTEPMPPKTLPDHLQDKEKPLDLKKPIGMDEAVDTKKISNIENPFPPKNPIKTAGADEWTAEAIVDKSQDETKTNPDKSTSSVSPYGYEKENYAWLCGKVDYNEGKKTWQIIYNITDHDLYGGSFELVDHPSLKNLSTDDIVEIEGQVDSSDTSQKPRYKIQKLSKMTLKKDANPLKKLFEK